jgi:hypothetical protein
MAASLCFASGVDQLVTVNGFESNPAVTRLSCLKGNWKVLKSSVKVSDSASKRKDLTTLSERSLSQPKGVANNFATLDHLTQIVL